MVSCGGGVDSADEASFGGGGVGLSRNGLAWDGVTRNINNLICSSFNHIAFQKRSQRAYGIVIATTPSST
jgi:hypothetical protein